MDLQSDADPESRNRFRIGANLKFLKLLINPVDLKDGVGNIFARKVMQSRTFFLAK